jgi:hypothetical protein
LFYFIIPCAVNQLFIAFVSVNKTKYFMYSNYKQMHISKYEGKILVTYPVYQHAPAVPVSDKQPAGTKTSPQITSPKAAYISVMLPHSTLR